MSLTLLVLAAGLGSRYGGLKQLAPVGPAGETILDYSVHDAVQAGFDRVVFVIRRDFAPEFEEVVARRWRERVAVGVVFQELVELPQAAGPFPDRKKPWGTGQAVWCARKAIDGPFAVINADDFYGRGSYEQLAGRLPRGTGGAIPEFLLVAYELGRTLSAHGGVSRGLVHARNGRLERLEETHGLRRSAAGITSATGVPQREDAPVSMNLWGFTPAVFGLLEKGFGRFLTAPDASAREFYLPEAVSDMVAEGTAAVRVVSTVESWLGVTYREDHPVVARAIQERAARGLYPDLQFSK